MQRGTLHRLPPLDAPRAALFLVTAAALACASGCYRKVVSARGIGAQGVNVQEPDNPNSRQMQTHRPLPASKTPATRRLVGGSPNAPK